MSNFGSHKNMIDENVTKNLGEKNLVACRDEYGLYITERNKLDDGKADYNRFNPERMNNVLKSNPNAYYYWKY